MKIVISRIRREGVAKTTRAGARAVGVVAVSMLTLPVPAGHAHATAWRQATVGVVGLEPAAAHPAGPASAATITPLQDGRIAGSIEDTEGNAIVGATLLLIQESRGIRIEFESDDQGEFFRRAIRPGEYVLRVQKEGYRPVEQPVRIGFRTTETTEVEIVMESEDLAAARARRAAASGAYGRGYEAFQEGDFEAAIEAIEQVIDSITDPEESRDVLSSALAILARSHLELGHTDEAIDAYERLLELTPEDAGAHLDVGQAYAAKGEYEDAAEHFEKALSLRPDDADANYNIGVILIQGGQVEEGIAALEACLELQPEYPLAHKSLGYGYARTSEYAKAIEHFEKYLEQMPDAPDRAEIEQFIAALKEQIG